jgi:hypothetical protein
LHADVEESMPKVDKKSPKWSSYTFTKEEWNEIKLLVTILKVNTFIVVPFCFSCGLIGLFWLQEAEMVQQIFSSHKEFTINRMIGVFEQLLHTWESFAKDPNILA